MHTEIPKAKELEQKVFNIKNEKHLASIALEVYHFQFTNNPVYQDYCNAVGRTPLSVQKLIDIPFLPISFFKTHRIESTSFDPQLIFKSSGTTGSQSSIHYVKDAALYKKSFQWGFRKFYGNPADYCIIGLLPSYLDRGQSSLIYMVDCLVKENAHKASGFYLHEFERLNQALNQLETTGQKTILIGVTYALMEFAVQFPQHLEHTIIMETGGMKGRMKELTRFELYDQLKASFGVLDIHSEYGMTELLSQAYAINGVFKSPPWMKVLLRDETDPFTLFDNSSKIISGAINLIDLANIYSCSFIATEDMGKAHPDGGFEVLGRMDHADIRGCSLMLV